MYYKLNPNNPDHSTFFSNTWEIVQQQVDPNSFGNLVEIGEYDFTNEAVDIVLDVDGDRDNMLMISCDNTITVNGSDKVYLQLNDDVTTNYKCAAHFGGISHSSEVYENETKMHLSWSSRSSGIGILKLKSGARRTYTCKLYHYNASEQSYVVDTIGGLKNTTNNVVKVKIFTNVNVLVSKVKVLKLQEIKPVELHSLELLHRYDFSSSAMSLEFDVDSDDEMLIFDYNLDFTVTDKPLKCLFNDDTSNNYQRVHLYGGTSGGSGQETTTYIELISSGNNAGKTFIHLNSNGNKYPRVIGSMIRSVSPDIFVLNNGGIYKQKTNITKITINTDASYVTGYLNVYRQVKTHLISQTPNLLHGLTIKYVDADTVQINPGEIEIAGVNCYLSKSTQIKLSTDLRTGETEQTLTDYYIYAVRGTGRNISFKLSSIAPTIDRYGNSYASFSEVNLHMSAHHPVEGIQLRYIGRVFNDNTNNLLPYLSVSVPDEQKGKYKLIDMTVTSLPVTIYGLNGLRDKNYIFKYSFDATNYSTDQNIGFRPNGDDVTSNYHQGRHYHLYRSGGSVAAQAYLIGSSNYLALLKLGLPTSLTNSIGDMVLNCEYGKCKYGRAKIFLSVVGSLNNNDSQYIDTALTDTTSNITLGTIVSDVSTTINGKLEILVDK